MNKDTQKKDIYISYKRSDGVMYARYIREKLVNKHYSVFFDLDVLKSGKTGPQFEKGIYNCKDFILIITPDAEKAFSNKKYNFDRMLAEDRWDIVREVATALKKGDNINIIPIIVNNTSLNSEWLQTISPVLINDGLQFRGNDKKPIEDSFFKLLYSYLQSTPKIFDYLSIPKHSSYTQHVSERELERLRIQEKYTRSIDNYALDYIKKTINKPSLCVLDIGCSDGYVTRKRFGDGFDYSKVIGLDINAEVISRAKNDEKFYFHRMDVTSDDFLNDLKCLMKTRGIESFDIVFIALAIHHLDDMERITLLKRIRQVMSTNGAVLLRGVDDGSIVAYNDHNYVEQSIDLSLKTNNMSDRYNGRKFYSHLCTSGFSNVSMYFDTETTVGKTREEKNELFKYYFAFRSEYTKKLREQDEQDEKFYDLDDKMRKVLSKLEDRFDDEDFFIMITSIAAVGYNL